MRYFTWKLEFFLNILSVLVDLYGNVFDSSCIFVAEKEFFIMHSFTLLNITCEIQYRTFMFCLVLLTAVSKVDTKFQLPCFNLERYTCSQLGERWTILCFLTIINEDFYANKIAKCFLLTKDSATSRTLASKPKKLEYFFLQSHTLC